MKERLRSYGNLRFRHWKPLMSVVFWGTSFIATKVALDELTPHVIILLRLILAVILLTTLAIYTKRDFSLQKKSHFGIFILALIAVFHLWIQVTGLKYTTAANTGWIIGTAPIFIAILGFIFFKERFSVLQLSGIVVAFFGLVLLISKGNLNNIDFISNRGDFLVLSSSFTWGVYSIVNKKISLEYSPLMTILYLFLMMAILIAPFNLDVESINSVTNLSMRGWIAIIFLGIFCSGFAYVFWAQSLKSMQTAKVGAFLYLEPFITVISAWSFLNENISLLMIISGTIIIVGVIMVTYK